MSKISEEILSKLHNREYWEKSHTKWGDTDTWNNYFTKKNPTATRCISHNALGTELQILVKNLESYTEESKKATAMCRDLLQLGKRKRNEKKENQQTSKKRHPTFIMTLFCLIKGEIPARAFSVKISKNKTVDDLKRLIKIEKPNSFAGIDTNELKLWNVKIPDSCANELVNLTLQDCDELLATKKIKKYFTEKPTKESIHVIISPPALTSAQKENINNVHSEEFCSHMTSGTQKKSEVIKIQDENIKRVLTIPPPSIAAHHLEFFNKVQHPQTILNHRPYDCLGPPVVFYNDVFHKFISDFENKDLLIPQKVLEMVKPLEEDMAKHYNVEKDRLKMLQGRLKDLFWPLQLQQVKNEDETVPDSIMTVFVQSLCEVATIILLEVKNEIGAGGSDPTIQGALSYVRRWAQGAFSNFRLCCNCPSIIIAVAGPWICILGAVYLEKGIIDPPTNFIPLVPFHHYSYFQRTARLLESLRLASDRLKIFYESLKPINEPDCQWFYPFPRQYQEDEGRVVNFNYIDWLMKDRTKFIWRAVTDEQCQIVVKFDQRYNVAAHKLCAKKGFAPQLVKQ